MCRTAVALGAGTLIQMGGRDLCTVHRTPCAGVIRTGVTTLGNMALTAAQIALQARAPKMHAALQAFRGTMRKLNEVKP